MTGSEPVTPPRRRNYGATTVQITHAPHRSDASDDLAPPDMNSILRRRRGYIPISPDMRRRLQVGLMCLSVAASAVQANGVYCWPTYGPVVVRQLGLSTTEAQTIVVGGILGVYLCAAPLGALVDRFGPRTGSLYSAIVAASGYFGFAAVLNANESRELVNGDGTYLALTACYFAVGAATVGSYFAALTTASLSFPSYPTLSLSVPLACMGLSSLFLSSFSVLPVFQVEGELDAARFLVFLGILSTTVNLFAAVFMRVIPPDVSCHHDDSDSDEEEHHNNYAELSASLHLDERSPLIIGGPEAALEDVEALAHGKDVRWSVAKLVRNPGFWIFGLVLSGCIGPSETIIATVGSIVTSVLPPDTAAHLLSLMSPMQHLSVTADTALSLRNKHVFILSIASTLARLITGFAADYLAPAPVPVLNHSDDPDAPEHIFVQEKPILLRRSAFCAICSALLASVFAWSAAYLDRESRLWILSGGVGALYGAIFTLTPAIVSTHFGPTNFGLAWGMVSYFPALGSAVFGYVYAKLAESATGVWTDPAICYGTKCFQQSFWLAAIGCFTSAVGIYLTGRRWRV